MKNENLENLKKCPHHDKCNQNLCPLNLGLHLMVGKEQDKCRWMREPQLKKIGGREFISGGRVMPNGILRGVPQSNLKWLNGSSRKAWLQLKSSN